jgi:dihydropteroate synthase
VHRNGDDHPTLAVRIEDAETVRAPGVARMVLSGAALQDPAVRTALLWAVEAAGGQGQERDGRVWTTVDTVALTTTLPQHVAPDLAARATERIVRAIDAWTAGAGDLVLADGRRLATGSRTLVQAVLNVTPDSFSDGGAHLGPDGDVTPAIEAGRAMIAAGADLIDVGGESTRPGAASVTEADELARTVPVVRALAADGAVVSIDTTKGAVARAAVDAGAAIVNDVSAGALDPDLYATVADLGVPYVLMHMQGTPRTMQRNPTYRDVVAEVFDHLAGHLERLEHAGVPNERVVIDPGIGFGKTLDHNLALLRQVRDLTSLGRPVLIGASRKTFIGTLTGVDDPADRLEGSLAVAALAAAGGARILRVHDVHETVRVLAVADAIAAAGGRPSADEPDPADVAPPTDI